MDPKKHVYAVLLGGKSDEGDLMEAHRLEFVVAESEAEAKNHAKARWNAVDMHVDGIRELDTVDGYMVDVREINRTTSLKRP